MEKELSTIIDGTSYLVHVTKKRQRNMYFRFRNGAFYVSCPYLVNDKRILEGVIKYGPRLIKRAQKSTLLSSFEENYVYIFGEKEVMPEGIDSEEKLDKYLKKILLEYTTNRVHELATLMRVSTIYKVRVRKMKSRHGSNSRKTKSITFQLSLVHYDKEIIDSVIYHELAHDKYFDHSAKFYNFLLSYCPNYFKLKAKLTKGIVQ